MTTYISEITKQDMVEMVKEYREKLYQQAKYLRENEGVVDIDSAVKYVVKWGKQDQVLNGGIMQGKRISFMKMCALLSHAIEPIADSDISINESAHGWSIYWEARDKGMFS